MSHIEDLLELIEEEWEERKRQERDLGARIRSRNLPKEKKLKGIFDEDEVDLNE